ncbi:hypothetical protein [Methylotuvimicrobium sp. KM1]|uniref:hypothetical protein n=1 Tax=Methylotuvimicrobium sp. KM1 TaxID=3377707 RepID=UPI00384AC1C3
MDFAVFLSSSVVGGLVAGFVALRNSERKILIENVTKERAKWREKIRIKSNEVYKAAEADESAKLLELRLEFSLNLNPFDNEDNAILGAIVNLKVSENREIKLAEFSERVALLLKHDWERAKFEAKPWFFRCYPPKRTTFAEWLKLRSSGTDTIASAP